MSSVTTKRIAGWVFDDDGGLKPAFVQLVGILLIVSATVYAFATSVVLTPIYGTGGTLLGVGQYLSVIQDIRALIKDKTNDEAQKN